MVFQGWWAEQDGSVGGVSKGIVGEISVVSEGNPCSEPIRLTQRVYILRVL